MLRSHRVYLTLVLFVLACRGLTLKSGAGVRSDDFGSAGRLLAASRGVLLEKGVRAWVKESQANSKRVQLYFFIIRGKHMEQEWEVQFQVCNTGTRERENTASPGRFFCGYPYPKGHTLTWSSLFKVIGWRRFPISDGWKTVAEIFSDLKSRTTQTSLWWPLLH